MTKIPSFIRCVKCGHSFLIDEYKCPQCGTPALKSMDREFTIYADPDKKIEIDVPEETKKLIEMLTPAFLDRNTIEEVSSQVKKYLDNRFSKYSFPYDTVYKPIEFVLQSAIRLREYERSNNDFYARVAINTYNKQMEEPVQGLGFSIITNDFISAATYLALDAHETKKQMLKQESNALKMLTENLSKIKSDTAMSESDIFRVLRAVEKSMQIAVKLAQSKQFITSHLDFYANPEKYNSSRTLNGINIYDYIASTVTRTRFFRYEKRSLLGRYFDRKTDDATISALDAAGYIWVPEPGIIVTTTKFEQEALTELYYREHPEERAKAEREKAEQNVQLYAQAEQDLRDGKYYEAALNFAKVSDYKDALLRSHKIWREHILQREWIHADTSQVCALKENGTVYFGGKPGGLTNLSEHQFRYNVSRWNNVAQLEMYVGMPFALLENGTVMNYLKPLSGNGYVSGDGTDWKHITQIAVCSHLVGLHSNGRVSAVGNNDKGQCYVSTWRNVKKIAAYHGVTMGLKEDGTVLIAGDAKFSKQPYQSWNNIVDISVNHDCAIGLTANGTVNAVGDNSCVQALAKWQGIKRICKTGTSIIGYTEDGHVKCFQAQNGNVFLKAQQNVVDVVRAGIGWLVLHADGTVTTKDVNYGISHWNNLVYINGDNDCAYGVTNDGRVLYVGNRLYGNDVYQQMTSWKLFADINTVDKNSQAIIQKNIEAQKESARKEIEACQKELSNLKRLFTGKRRKELENRIQELEILLKF